jgi:hypothetical protein
MKICLISFDYWNYDHHIVTALEKKGIEAHSIDISKYAYKYKNIFQKIENFFNKLFFKKNIKKIKRQQFIIEELSKLGQQDSILVIRPDLIDLDTHNVIKENTKSYIAYIYDSCKRFPVDHLLDGVFDRIFSFDLEDVKLFGFEHITNFIYLDKQAITSNFKYDVFIVLSPDKRITQLNAIAAQLENLQINYKFILVSKGKPSELHPGIEHRSNEVKAEELKTYIDNSKVILDLVRKNHNGISFRIFEALAFQKKIITNNTSVKNYSFYNPNNVLVLDPLNIKIDRAFFETDYQPLAQNIYNQFTIDRFTDVVFNLDKQIT